MRTLRNILLLPLMLTLFASCEKMGDNDQISGFWQLVSVQDGTTITDVTADQIYWGMQNRIISIRSIVVAFSKYSDGENSYELIGRYLKNGETLVIEELYYHYDSHDETIPEITDVLRRCGIDEIHAQYDIERNGNMLTLKSKSHQLVLRKA